MPALIGFPCSCGRVRGFFCWGNPNLSLPNACARMSGLTALYLFSYFCLMCLGYPLHICPREGLTFPACFHVYFLSLFPVSFTLVKYCADLSTICPRSGYPTNTNQHRLNLPKYTTKAGTKKIFFHLNH